MDTNEPVNILDFDDLSLFQQGDVKTRYIKLEFKNFTHSNVVNSYGFVDSTLERGLKSLIVPKNGFLTISSTNPKNKTYVCFDQQAGTLLATYCSLSVHDPDRIKFGCSGKPRTNSTIISSQNTDNEHQDGIQAYSMILNPQLQRRFETGWNNQCNVYNKRFMTEKNSGVDNIRSKPFVLGNYVLYLQSVKGEEANAKIVVFDMSKEIKNK